MALTLRQVCKETGKRPSKVLLYFPKEKRTGIAPTRLILEKDKNLAENTKVTVNWQGKKVEAKILALSGKYFMLDREVFNLYMPSIVKVSK